MLLSVALTFAQMFFAALLSYVGVAYLAITISATILNSRKGRGFLSFALFCAIVYGLSCISGLYVYNCPGERLLPFPTFACSCPSAFAERARGGAFPRSSAHGC